ncbi:MAG TPA: Glu-tRNA(Gln) amidotransferase subunit GatE [Acidobacteriota bacterium]|nr:Glu-tRNA(Gln) amidotransferase subunit GatE [Acidobacteriota bacterium]
MTQLTEINYGQVGLRSGIEIHQQLEGRKLFCQTPTVIRDDAAHYTITRTLRAVVGETGVIDSAAAAEAAKKKIYQYQGYSDTIGLVELDEEPPHNVNPDALTVALQVSQLLHATTTDEIQFMRKTVVDGSNTSGFQRTGLVGRNGYLLTDTNKRISIPTVILEEDSAKKVSAQDDVVTYNLSRLGIPLLEICTGPDMSSAQEVAHVAEKIGLLLRSTGRVKRGIGTIRQDLNVSIRGGNRVEIKGAQDLKLIPTYVDYEIIRQQSLIELAPVIKKALPLIKPHFVDVSAVFGHTQCALISKALKQNKKVVGLKVPLHSYLGRELQPGKRLGTDLSDFAKVHAGIGGIIHSDESMDKYSISIAEVEEVKQSLGFTSADDAFMLIVDSAATCDRAFHAVLERLRLLCAGVPKEVRQPNADGTTTYLRPMPGEARMYPETDVLPVKPDITHIPRVELIDDKAARYVKTMHIPSDRAKMIAKSEESFLFDSLVTTYTNVKPATIVELLFGSTRKEVEKQIGSAIELTSEILQRSLSLVDKGTVPASSLAACVVSLVKQPSISDSALASQFKQMSDEQILTIIKSVKDANPGIAGGALMGKVMAACKGQADGKRVGELIANGR